MALYRVVLEVTRNSKVNCALDASSNRSFQRPSAKVNWIYSSKAQLASILQLCCVLQVVGETHGNMDMMCLYLDRI